MKQILLVIAGLMPAMVFAQKQTAVAYQLNAEVNFPEYDQTGRVIYFTYLQDGKQITDSAVIVKNKFSFGGRADVNIKASLQFTRPLATPEPALDPNLLTFYLNAGSTSLKAAGNLSRAVVSGSPMQEEYAAFKQKYTRMDRAITSFGWRKRGLKETDSLQLQSINRGIDSIQNIKMNMICDFLDQQINKPYAAEALVMYLKAKGSSLNINKAESYFKQLPEEQKQAPDGQDAVKLIANLRKP